MPRKYRPPESRRRKSGRTASPHIFEQPLDDGDASAAVLNDALLVEKAQVPAIAERRSAAQSSRTTAVKHISRDYGYVRGEIGRIVLVAGFLIVSLIITALLRN